jgi:subtilisin family serine protease
MTSLSPLSRRTILFGGCVLAVLHLAQCRPASTSECQAESEFPSSAASPAGQPSARDDPPSQHPIANPPPHLFLAVVDSGIDAAHPLFANAFASTDRLRGIVPDASLADAGPRFLGWNFVEDDPHPDDHTGHGTHVAGILAQELALTEEDSPFRLLVFRTGNQTHHLAHLTRAVELATDLKKAGLQIPLIVLPLEYYPDPREADLLAQFESALQDLLDERTLAVCAAGNKGQNNDDPSGALHCYPSDFALPGLLSVACCNESGHLHALTNFGAVSVDLAAPGFGIESAALRGGTTQSTGSSQSCALVAASAARHWIAAPDQPASAIRQAVLAEARVHPSLVGRTVTNGYLPRPPRDPVADPEQ